MENKTPSPQAVASPSSDSRNRSRRSSMPKRDFQRRFAILIAGFSGLLVLFMFITEFDYVRNLVLENPFRPDMADLLDWAFLGFVVRYLLYVASVGLFVIVALHFVAGPVYRIERVARAVTSGDLTQRVKLRKHDELRELENDFNAMVEALQDNIKEERAKVEALTAQADGLAQRKDLPRDAAESLAGLKNGLTALLRRFKT